MFTADLNTMSTDSLNAIAEQINQILARRLWKAGDKAYWASRGNVMQGEVVLINANGSLCVKKKGELQYGTVLPPTKAYRSYEAACRASK